MRRQLLTIREESAFYLPFVLMMIVIIFIVVLSSITIYQNELELTDSITEQLEVETLFQMARTQFIQDKPYIKQSNGKLTYEFPSGSVTLTYQQVEEKNINIILNIKTKSNKRYQMTHDLLLNDEIANDLYHEDMFMKNGRC